NAQGQQSTSGVPTTSRKRAQQLRNPAAQKKVKTSTGPIKNRDKDRQHNEGTPTPSKTRWKTGKVSDNSTALRASTPDMSPLFERLTPPRANHITHSDHGLQPAWAATNQWTVAGQSNQRPSYFQSEGPATIKDGPTDQHDFNKRMVHDQTTPRPSGTMFKQLPAIPTEERTTTDMKDLASTVPKSSTSTIASLFAGLRSMFFSQDTEAKKEQLAQRKRDLRRQLIHMGAMRIKTEDVLDMGATPSSERHATEIPVLEEGPQEVKRSYGQLMKDCRKTYTDQLPPFILQPSSNVRHGERREVVLATPDGKLPDNPSSVGTMTARRWDHGKMFCFWTIKHGADRFILAPRAGGCGFFGGCRYVLWLGEGQGANGFSERAFAFSMPSEKAVARYPHLASKPIVKPSSPLPQPSEVITREDDIEDMIRKDRAYYGSDDLPPYIETRWPKNGLGHDYASFTTDAADEHGIETGTTIQVFSREWDELHRYWVAEFDGKLHIIQRCKNNNKGSQVRLWLGHKRGLGRVLGHGISKKDDGGPKELISLNGASEKRMPSAKRKARPPNSLARGKRPTRNSELPLLLDFVHHKNPTQLYSEESSSGSEYDDFEMVDTGFDTSSPEPGSASRPVKKPCTKLLRENDERSGGRTGLATPDSTSATKTLSPPIESISSRPTASPQPTMETRLRVYPRITGRDSYVKSTTAHETKPSPKLLGTRKRPYLSIETPSVSDLRLSSEGRVSSTRSLSKEITRNMPEPVPKIPSEKRRAASTVEKQSVSHDETLSAGRASNAQSQPNEITPDTTKLPSEVLSERRRKYSTVEPRSVSHLRASNIGKASSARYQSREITPDTQELPLKSPSADEQ
ncbi:MAG: hypothetical protein Q9180_005174, partial [Flavoplaca navasiana]